MRRVLLTQAQCLVKRSLSTSLFVSRGQSMLSPRCYQLSPSLSRPASSLSLSFPTTAAAQQSRHVLLHEPQGVSPPLSSGSKGKPTQQQQQQQQTVRSTAFVSPQSIPSQGRAEQGREESTHERHHSKNGGRKERKRRRASSSSSSSFWSRTGAVALGLTFFGLGGPSREERQKALKQEAFEAMRRSSMPALRRVMVRAAALGDVELRDELDRSLAAVAASKGKLEPLRFLVNQGADPSAVDKHGISVLAYAAWKGQSVIVEYLLKSCGLAPEGAPDVFGLYPMHKAAGYGQAAVLRLLLAAGADVNLPTAEVTAPPSYEAKSKIETALAIATRLGFHNAMRVLLEQPRVRVDQEDRHGDTALHWAARRGDWRGVQILTSAGADSSVKNRAGQSPVDVAPRWLRAALATGLIRLYPSKAMAWLDPTWRDELP